jgi:hypothetical protein
MGDSLCVCCDTVVLLGSEVDVLGPKTGHDVLDESEVGVRCAVLDQDQWLALRVDAWAVKRVDTNDADIFRQVLLKGINLWSFA